MKRCKNCKHWYQNQIQEDGSAECLQLSEFGKHHPQRFELEYSSLDDSGFNANLFVGPEFGCVLFEPKEIL